MKVADIGSKTIYRIFKSNGNKQVNDGTGNENYAVNYQSKSHIVAE